MATHLQTYLQFALNVRKRVKSYNFYSKQLGQELPDLSDPNKDVDIDFPGLLEVFNQKVNFFSVSIVSRNFLQQKTLQILQLIALSTLFEKITALMVSHLNQFWWTTLLDFKVYV